MASTGAVVVDAVRSPVGLRDGALAAWHPVDLAAEVVAALLRRNDVDPAAVDDVVAGCVTQTGEQGFNIGRSVALAAGLADTVPGVTVDRQCASSQQAVHFAAQGVMAGAYDLVVAVGVESMSRVPAGSTLTRGPGGPFGPRLDRRYRSAGGLVPHGVAVERLAERWGLARDELDGYSVESHRRAARATRAGRFEREIVPLLTRPEGVGRRVSADEGIRPRCNSKELAALKPSFVPGGAVTAGNSGQLGDAAAAVLIASEARAAELGLTPRARLVSFAVSGADPLGRGAGADPATGRALERAGLRLEDVDVVEVNENFAAVVLAWQQAHRADPGRVNVNGGAIALGHPLGASGARVLTTLVWELQRRRRRFGLQVMNAAGGMTTAAVLERLA